MASSATPQSPPRGDALRHVDVLPQDEPLREDVVVEHLRAQPVLRESSMSRRTISDSDSTLMPGRPSRLAAAGISAR